MGGTFTGNVSISGTLASGALTVTGTVKVSTNAIIGSVSETPLGTLHVFTADSGAGVSGALDDFVVENDTNGGISIVVPDASESGIGFSSPTSTLGAFINWRYSTGLFHAGSRKVGAVFRLSGDLSIRNLDLAGASGSETAVFAGTVQATDGLGTNGVTPVGQASAIADPTDLATSISAIEDILVVIESLGFIAT